MSDQDTFNQEALEKCFDNVSTQTGVAMAVSGGPDSMALLLLTDRWRCARLQQGQSAPDLTVFTVDHGLRPAAVEECQFVLEKAKALGYDAHILQREGEPPTTRIQEMARKIRYQLLAEACHLRGIKILMTAHHLDDQAETVLMRLARGSGVDGLSAMALQSQRYGLRLLRPLLVFEKTELLELLQANDWKYIKDPSNTDPRFERVRLREHVSELKKLGLTAKMIGLTARRLGRAKMALDEASNQFLTSHAFVSDYGTARIDQLALFDTPDEIAIRALSKVLQACGGSQEVPNMARLETLVGRLKADFSTNRTLAGCRLIAKGDFWLIAREAGRITELEKPIVPGGCMLWDNRYIVCAGKKASTEIIAVPLGEGRELIDLAEESLLKNFPKDALPSLLTLRNKGEIIAVPAFDYWKAQAISAGLQARFITSDDGLV
ncbi:MAG: tRNA lysidine(34) synthetase TilS [bacterium]|nr:tRNA lysidine(34) synthetase TilS [bacterium]